MIIKNYTYVLTTLIVLLFFFNAYAGISEEKRVALVFGNSKYQSISSLPNAKNDARLVKSTLEQLHFDVIYSEDNNASTMEKKVRLFGKQLKSADVGLFYYAGHAIQYAGANYLIPTDLPPDMDADSAKWKSIHVNLIVEKMEHAKNPTNIIILDSCRDNPFEKKARSLGSVRTRGMAPINSNVNGMYIAYSTSPNDVASDGKGSNSPYTLALSRHMAKPGLSIHQVFTNVTREVKQVTKGNQRPWAHSSLDGEFYFAGVKTSQDNEIERLKQELSRFKQFAAQSEPKSNNQNTESISTTSKMNNSKVEPKLDNSGALKDLLQFPNSATEESSADSQVAIIEKHPVAHAMNQKCLNKYKNYESSRTTKKSIKCFDEILTKYPGESEALSNLANIADHYANKIDDYIRRKKFRAAKNSIAILKTINSSRANEYEHQLDQYKHAPDMNKKCWDQYKSFESSRGIIESIKCFKVILTKFPGEKESIRKLSKISDYYEKLIVSDIQQRKYSNAKNSIAIIKAINESKANKYQKHLEQKQKDINYKINNSDAF